MRYLETSVVQPFDFVYPVCVFRFRRFSLPPQPRRRLGDAQVALIADQVHIFDTFKKTSLKE
jgi:hypothetical protein